MDPDNGEQCSCHILDLILHLLSHPKWLVAPSTNFPPLLPNPCLLFTGKLKSTKGSDLLKLPVLERGEVRTWSFWAPKSFGKE